MNRGKILCVVVSVLVFCITLSSCEAKPGMLRASPEVQFSVPQNVQIYFNNQVYNTIIVFENNKLEMNFDDENSLLGGAYVSIDSVNYKITYKDMVFKGETNKLAQTFLPSIVYSFFESQVQAIPFESFDENKGCYYIESNINEYFVVLELYKSQESIVLSMEIK